MRKTTRSLLKSLLPFLPSLLCSPVWAGVLYVSPQAKPNASCSAADPCSLVQARERARALLPAATGDVIVQLSGGVYEMNAAFTLDARDAGRPGVHMVYQAAPGQIPILSGGRPVVGWTLFDEDRDIWCARVPTGLRTRQIYVNEVRAVRARGQTDPGGFVKTGTGFRTSGNLDFLMGARNAEVVSRLTWKEFRCPVDSVSGEEIRMAEPCWSQSQADVSMPLNRISWFENAYSLLDEEGEWYLDDSCGRLYYKPRAADNMLTARVVAPVLESLLIARGTADHPLANLRISGLTFAYSTWMLPSTGVGYPDLQSTYMYGDDGYGGDKIPSSVAFWFADSLVLEDNAFRAMGGNGPALEAGCRHDRISGNRIADISGNGLHIGNITANPRDIRERVEGITVDNNSVARIGQEYHGACGIFVGYVAETRVLHNDISEVPYTGISLGWGWGRPANMKNNEVAYNHVHHHMNTLADGGGIYTLGSQPGTRIHHNFVHDQAHDYGALYPDQGSSYLRWDSNVVQGVRQWFFMSNGGMYGNAIFGNYSDTRSAVIVGIECQVDSNHVVSDGEWPSGALDIIAEAGLEMRFREESQPTGFLSARGGKAKGALAIPGTDPALFKTAPQRGRWRWVAPARARNLLGAAIAP